MPGFGKLKWVEDFSGGPELTLWSPYLSYFSVPVSVLSLMELLVALNKSSFLFPSHMPFSPSFK